MKKISQSLRQTDDDPKNYKQLLVVSGEPPSALPPTDHQQYSPDTPWKHTPDDRKKFARFMYNLVGEYNENFAAQVLGVAVRAKSVDEVISLCRRKASRRTPPRGTGWFLVVVREHFGPVNDDGSPVDRQSVLQSAIAHFGGYTKIPYGWTQMYWEDPHRAAECLPTWPRAGKEDR